MKKINYWMIMLIFAGTFIASCGSPDEDPEPEPEPEPALKDSLWLTSFEYVASPFKPDSSDYAGSFNYSFDVTTGMVVTAGSVGVPTTAVTGTKIYQMKSAAAQSAAYYGGGFGWGPGTGNTFDTLDVNDKFSFWYNYNGNTETSLKVQLVDPVDNDVFIKNIPAGGTGWQRANLRLSTFTWDANDPANTAGAHDKKMNVTSLTAFKFIYFNPVAGTPLEVYIDDIKIIDHEGGSKILQP